MEEITIVELELEAKYDSMTIKKGQKRYFPYVREDMIHLITGELWKKVKAKPKIKL